MTTRTDPNREKKSAKDRSFLNKGFKNWSIKEWMMIFSFLGFSGTAINSGTIADSFQGLFSPISTEQFKQLTDDIAQIKKENTEINKTLNGNFHLMINDYKKMSESGFDFHDMAGHLTDENIHESDLRKRSRIISEFNVRISPFITDINYLKSSIERIERKLP